MKIDRLLGILTILLQNDRVTAPILLRNLKLLDVPLEEILILFVSPGYLLLHIKVVVVVFPLQKASRLIKVF